MMDDMARQNRPKVLLKRWWPWVLAVCLVAAGAFAYLTNSGGMPSRLSKQAAGTNARGVPVVVTTVKKGDIRIYLNGLGSVTPVNTVTVKSRVDGQLMKVSFKEGQIVNSGELLAEIDPRPFEAQLTQAAGQMARDQALLDNARVDLQRYRELLAQDSIAKQQVDTQEALVRQYEGALKLDQGQVDNARLQLLYCRITAPISGRVGLRLVDTGNIVHANDPNGLVVITQLQPITVVFSIPEDDLPAVMRNLKAGERLQVAAFNREQTQKISEGFLLTVDNQIDPTTGTVKLKAIFPNKLNELFPNQFVNARLQLETRRAVILAPSAAVQRNPQGAYVYLVKPDQTVTVHQVRLGPTEGDMVSIVEGLSSGDQVVVEGAERLREGSKVELQGAREPSNHKKG